MTKTREERIEMMMQLMNKRVKEMVAAGKSQENISLYVSKMLEAMAVIK